MGISSSGNETIRRRYCVATDFHQPDLSSYNFAAYAYSCYLDRRLDILKSGI